MKKTLVLLLLACTSVIYAQDLLIKIDRPCEVKLDGESLGEFEADDIKKVMGVTLGKHIIQAKSLDGIYKLEQVELISDSVQHIAYLKAWKVQSRKLVDYTFDGEMQPFAEGAGGKAFLVNENAAQRSPHLYITNGGPIEILKREIVDFEGHECVWVKCRHTEGWMKISDMAFKKAGFKLNQLK